MKKVEVSYKEVAIAILRRWYVVLIVAAAFAFVYSNYARNKAKQDLLAEAEYHAQVAYDEEIAAYEDAKDAYDEYRKAMTEYQKASAEYWKNLNENKQMVEELKAQIVRVEDYLKNGIKPNVDPYNFASATLTMDLDTEESHLILNRATNHYLALAQEAPLDVVLEGVIPEGYNISYVQEILTFRRLDNDLLVITAIGSDQIDAEKIVTAMADYLASQKDLVTKSAGTHTFTMINEGPRRGMDIGLVNVRAGQENRLNVLNRWLADTENAIKAKPAKPVQKSAKLELPEAPLKPVRPPRPMKPAAPTRERVMAQIEEDMAEASSPMKYWVMGILGGIILGSLLVMICYLIRLPIQYPMQLQKQLGMTYLGGKPGDGKRLKEAELIAANLREGPHALQKVLLTGRLPEDTLSAVVQSLQGQETLKDHQLLSGANVLENPATVTKLGQADGAVLVVKQYHSKLRDINTDMERIAHSGKPLAGYIVI